MRIPTNYLIETLQKKKANRVRVVIHGMQDRQFKKKDWLKNIE